MNFKKITPDFILIGVAILALVITVYDLMALNNGGTEATISHVIMVWSYKYPLFTWFAGFIPGVLVGHLFWRIRDSKKTDKLGREIPK